MATIWSSPELVICSSEKSMTIFNDMPNVFGIADVILVVGYDTDGKDHDEMVQRVLQRCKEVNLKPYKEKCHFGCMSITFFNEIISRNRVKPTSQRSASLWKCHHPMPEKSSRAFLGIINYLGKFSPNTVAVYKPLCKLTSSKAVWTLNAS